MIPSRTKLAAIGVAVICICSIGTASADTLLLFDDFSTGLGNWTIDLGEWYNIDNEFCYNPDCVP